MTKNKKGKKKVESEYAGMEKGSYRVVKTRQSTDRSKRTLFTVVCGDCGNKKTISQRDFLGSLPVCRRCLQLKARAWREEFVGHRIGALEVIGFRKGTEMMTVFRCVYCEETHERRESDVKYSGSSGFCPSCRAGSTTSLEPGYMAGPLELVDTFTDDMGRLLTRSRCVLCKEDQVMPVPTFRSKASCPLCRATMRVYTSRAAARGRFIQVMDNLGIHECSVCGVDKWMGGDLELDVDHIVPIKLGGKHQLSNLQYLCPNCHKQKTVKERDEKRSPPSKDLQKLKTA